jgi:hypothetical protein
MPTEFMFYIRNKKNAKKLLSENEQLAFIKNCEVYINELKKTGNLIAAQPLIKEGVLLTKTPESWVVKDISENENIQVGYYHIIADSLEEAVEIAKRNPEFSYIPSASIEVRPIKTKEVQTGYIYPSKK